MVETTTLLFTWSWVRSRGRKITSCNCTKTKIKGQAKWLGETEPPTFCNTKERKSGGLSCRVELSPGVSSNNTEQLLNSTGGIINPLVKNGRSCATKAYDGTTLHHQLPPSQGVKGRDKARTHYFPPVIVVPVLGIHLEHPAQLPASPWSERQKGGLFVLS